MIEGNWTNNAANTVFTNTDNDGWVRFKGTGAETIGGSADTRFEYMEFNNNGNGTPISLSRDVIVEGICRFTDGGSDIYIHWGGVYAPIIMKAITAP